MGKHNETGKLGETLAEEFLLHKGYQIWYRNWRTGKMEVDLIASYEGQWVLVEVKTRQCNGMGFPEEAVGARKKQLLRLAAEIFLYDHSQFPTLRYDIVSVELFPNNQASIRHYEDAFY